MLELYYEHIQIEQNYILNDYIYIQNDYHR